MNAEDNLNKLIENKINDLNELYKETTDWIMSLERFQKFCNVFVFLSFFSYKYITNLL